MKNKSIISLISFFFLSMFYVGSASAGPTYLNVKMPQECGFWKVAPGAQHCIVRGPSNGKAGKDTAFKCVGGGNGKGGVGINTQHCGQIIFSTYKIGDMHHSYVSKGYAYLSHTSNTTKTRNNTHMFVVCRPTYKEERVKKNGKIYCRS